MDIGSTYLPTFSENPKSMTHQETIMSASEDALNIPSLVSVLGQ